MGVPVDSLPTPSTLSSYDHFVFLFQGTFFHCFLDLILYFVDTCRCQQVNSKQIVSSAVLRRPRSGRDLRRRTLTVLAFHGKVVDSIFLFPYELRFEMGVKNIKYCNNYIVFFIRELQLRFSLVIFPVSIVRCNY